MLAWPKLDTAEASSAGVDRAHAVAVGFEQPDGAVAVVAEEVGAVERGDLRARGTRTRRSPSTAGRRARSRTTGASTSVGALPSVRVVAFEPVPAEVVACRRRGRSSPARGRSPPTRSDPTSPIQRSPVCGRTRTATGCAGRTTRSRARRPACPANGLSAGTVYGGVAGGRRVDAQDLAEQRVERLAVAARHVPGPGSPAPPPSPSPR